jgi:hypothetical protein
VSFESSFGKSTAPVPPLFVRFQKGWDAVDKGQLEKLVDNRLKKPFLKQLVKDNLHCLKSILESKTTLPRDDYKELAELCILVLGGQVGTEGSNYQFKKCGPCHHARWMSKIIYCFKIYLLRWVSFSKYLLSRQQQNFLSLSLIDLNSNSPLPIRKNCMNCVYFIHLSM